MLRRNAKTILATAGIVGVLGAGVAVAADTSTCPYGNTPKATQTQMQTHQQLRKRDGTGPRHAQRAQQRDRDRQGQGARHQGAGHHGNGNPSCPYRS